ncbi:MAG: hypothetical protein ACKVY0_23530 [Prosthecobacter sp.]|uniref:hypothetical protein n=1 Tax=Prosthecobacter sp. TaxID=1965333 RepID=UPI0039027EB9
MHNHLLFGLAALWLSVASAGAATITIDNLNAAGDGAFGLADNSGTLLTTATGRVIIGRMTMSDASITNHFNLGNIADIWAAFQPFDTAFNPDSLAPGAFQLDRIADTRASHNALGGNAIYVWAWNNTSATPVSATQGLIAHLSDVFPTDPELPGSPLTAVAHLRSPAALVVGAVGTSYDYNLGSGPLPTYQLSVAGAAPEPSRAALALIGACFVFFRRRR